LTNLETNRSLGVLIERFEYVMSVEAGVCFSVAQVIKTVKTNQNYRGYSCVKAQHCTYRPTACLSAAIFCNISHFFSMAGFLPCTPRVLRWRCMQSCSST